jgi:hypothetical protein
MWLGCSSNTHIPDKIRLTPHICTGNVGEVCCTGEGQPIPDCPNGLGNLIVGYNEPRPGGFENIRTGSHNVVVGRWHNFSRFGGLVVGHSNTISGDFAVVSGGYLNKARGGDAVGGSAMRPVARAPWSVGGSRIRPVAITPRSVGGPTTRPVAVATREHKRLCPRTSQFSTQIPALAHFW